MTKIYQNLDLTLNKFFIRKDFTELVTDITQLKYHRLDQNFYFRPSACPLLNVNDSEAGSCFEDYNIPTASYKFHVDTTVHAIPLEKNLNIDIYVDKLYYDIKNRIEQIYQRHQYVTLSYSGGIDSMVILSYIYNLGLLPRTDIICYKNNTQEIKDTTKIDLLLDLIKDQTKSIKWLPVESEEVIVNFNHLNLEHVKCYATNLVLKQSKNQAVLFGHHGNQVLLHKIIFADEILLNRPDAISEITELVNGPHTFYTQSLLDFNPAAPRIGIDRRHMLMKPWSALSTYDRIVYSPLADNDTFNQLRTLDYRQIKISTIANANIAQIIMNRNTGTLLDTYIETESIKENDVLANMIIPIDRLDPKLLVIPNNLNHHPIGLEYIQTELATAHHSKELPINTLVVIKALQWLSQKLGLL
jgi:hypothetical protein